MLTVVLFSSLLILGLVISQLLPPALPESAQRPYNTSVQVLTQFFLAYIMFHVGVEFTLDKSRLRSYGVDYLITAGAANVPWVMVLLYIGFLLPPDAESAGAAWKQTLLLARFVAPTSAGVLFSMLAAADLQDSWLFSKARVIAVFDDLDTILWLIPLKLILTGFQWEAMVVVAVMIALLMLAWFQLHAWRVSVSWPWVLLYSAVITGVCQAAAWLTGEAIMGMNAIVVEVLLPAFALGACCKEPEHYSAAQQTMENRVAVVASAVFLLFVGMSIPPFFTDSSSVAQLDWGEVVGHVVAISVMMNAGKMVPSFFYRDQASLRERVALGIGIWPRGEVGAGILIVAVGLGVSGLCVLVCALTLAVNLVLIGLYVYVVKYLLVSAIPGEIVAGAVNTTGDCTKDQHCELKSGDAGSYLSAGVHHETSESRKNSLGVEQGRL